MKPPAKLHNKTGRLKNINKSYTTTAPDTTSTSTQRSNTTNRTTALTNETATTPTATSSNVTVSNNGLDTAAIEQFELELCWCIQTLEKSLESNKLNAKQVQDVEKTVRLLKSSNQPLIKKRQLMQTNLGNYRKKMQDEEKKLRAGNNVVQFIVDTDANKANTPKSGSTVNGKGHFVKKSFAASLGESRFQFNFPVEAIEKLSLDKGNESNEQAAQPQANVTTIETNDSNQHNTNTVDNQPAADVHANQIAKTKFVASDNSFKFNFSID